MSETITLTRREIFDLAKAASLIDWRATFESCNSSDEEDHIEYTIFGGIEIEEDDGTKSKYGHGACLAEYPEEGTHPLGDKLP